MYINTTVAITLLALMQVAMGLTVDLHLPETHAALQFVAWPLAAIVVLQDYLTRKKP